MSCFETVVELFRYVGRPKFDAINNRFSATISYDAHIYELLVSLQPHTAWGEIEEIVIDDVDIDVDDSFPAEGTSITLTISISTGASESFFIDIKDLIQKSPMLNRGTLRKSFYLVEEDFYFNEGMGEGLAKIPELSVLKNLCDFILCLSKVAHYSNSKSDDVCHKLVFLKNTNAKSLPLIIETNVDYSLLLTGIKDLKIIESFSDEKRAITDDNYFERKGIFINTVVDFLESIDVKKQFHFLFCEWDEFLKLYHNNLGVYLSGFSFHKVRKEVAEAEANLAERFSKIMSDMIAKLLGIPVSLVATFGMIKLNALPEMLVVFLGVLLTSIIMFFIVRSQYTQFRMICDAKDIIFSPLVKKSVGYTEDLKKLVCNAKDNLDKNQVMLNRYLLFFQCLCWIPTALGGGMILMAIMVHLGLL